VTLSLQCPRGAGSEGAGSWRGGGRGTGGGVLPSEASHGSSAASYLHQGAIHTWPQP